MSDRNCVVFPRPSVSVSFLNFRHNSRTSSASPGIGCCPRPFSVAGGGAHRHGKTLLGAQLGPERASRKERGEARKPAALTLESLEGATETLDAGICRLAPRPATRAPCPCQSDCLLIELDGGEEAWLSAFTSEEDGSETGLSPLFVASNAVCSTVGTSSDLRSQSFEQCERASIASATSIQYFDHGLHLQDPSTAPRQCPPGVDLQSPTREAVLESDKHSASEMNHTHIAILPSLYYREWIARIAARIAAITSSAKPPNEDPLIDIPPDEARSDKRNKNRQASTLFKVGLDCSLGSPFPPPDTAPCLFQSSPLVNSTLRPASADDGGRCIQEPASSHLHLQQLSKIYDLRLPHQASTEHERSPISFYCLHAFADRLHRVDVGSQLACFKLEALPPCPGSICVNCFFASVAERALAKETFISRNCRPCDQPLEPGEKKATKRNGAAAAGHLASLATIHLNREPFCFLFSDSPDAVLISDASHAATARQESLDSKLRAATQPRCTDVHTDSWTAKDFPLVCSADSVTRRVPLCTCVRVILQILAACMPPKIAQEARPSKNRLVGVVTKSSGLHIERTPHTSHLACVPLRDETASQMTIQYGWLPSLTAAPAGWKAVTGSRKLALGFSTVDPGWHLPRNMLGPAFGQRLVSSALSPSFYGAHLLNVHIVVFSAFYPVIMIPARLPGKNISRTRLCHFKCLGRILDALVVQASQLLFLSMSVEGSPRAADITTRNSLCAFCFWGFIYSFGGRADLSSRTWGDRQISFPSTSRSILGCHGLPRNTLIETSIETSEESIKGSSGGCIPLADVRDCSIWQHARVVLSQSRVSEPFKTSLRHLQPQVWPTTNTANRPSDILHPQPPGLLQCFFLPRYPFSCKNLCAITVSSRAVLYWVVEYLSYMPHSGAPEAEYPQSESKTHSLKTTTDSAPRSTVRPYRFSFPGIRVSSASQHSAPNTLIRAMRTNVAILLFLHPDFEPDVSSPSDVEYGLRLG
ncbi:uncharacterized protein BDR25DRAFT_355093 [Lindgomyces ingoldianus]|uniref:Uncharacterized protein n=1 Tax=Lindgomyces ingoldianus TaxID=673940 RepID=A0ACB6QUT2_9PLEO|nr:uncharacterized protein BDR25DRAFT_355093 [Lindgomyces ingoldianus]KAF2470606.1 hypothetical protein BDR25DRAFT_355093 [Lindgomyces ingoldianus]